MMKGLP